MKRILGFFKTIVDWIFSLVSYYKVKYVEEEPFELENAFIYIVSEEGYDWAVVFYCPCGCKETIRLSLLNNSRPRWSYKIKRGRLNLYPSVQKVNGCKSHFHIVEGKVKWCS